MKTKENLRNRLTKRRKEILEGLGGLPEVEVKNREWLYLLGEETRFSIMIEGVFVSEDELEKILSGGRGETREAEDALNYFRTAKFIYGLGYENYRSGEFFLNLPLVRQVNHGVLGKGGEFRKGDISIAGTRFKPPDFHLIPELVEMWARWTEEYFNKLPVLTLASRSHILFEIIHPFEDGNGRTGRILFNYTLISLGYPPVILKEEKEKYYRAIEEGEREFRKIRFEELNYPRLKDMMERMKTDKMEKLIFTSLRENMDLIIVSLFEKKKEKLLPADVVAEKMGYSKDSMRTLIKRGKFIGVKRGRKWYTHPELCLM